MNVDKAIEDAWARLGVPKTLPPSKYTTIVDFLRETVARFPDNPAYTCLGHTITYRELDQLSDRFAGYLQQHSGLKPGARLAIQLPNLNQYLVVAFGALKAGMVLVNINPMYSEAELAYQLNHANVKLVVVFDQFLPKLQAVVSETEVEKVVVTSPFDFHPKAKRLMMSVVLKLLGKSPARGTAVSLRLAIDEVQCSAFEPVSRNGEDMALLQYTGGTTGVSKPTVISHRNLVSVTEQGMEMFCSAGLEPGQERIVSPLPLYHIYAFALSVMVNVHLGAHCLLITDPRQTNNFVKLLKKWPMSIMTGLNTLYAALLANKDFNNIDFSALKITLSGGMALTKGVAEEWHERTGKPVSEGYGLTETSPLLTLSPAGYEKQGSVGIPLPNTEIRIVDDSGQSLAVGEHGELWARGPQVMQGYFGFPEETALVLTDDGWLKTGDIASVDEEGYVAIHDRQKDMILVSGFNVYPNEIESVLSKHPDIAYSAAISVPDEQTGEAVKVFLVSTNPDLTEDAVRAYCEELLTRYKLPKYIEFRDELPLSNVGKVLRRELRPES